jgi:hypothetical protein
MAKPDDPLKTMEYLLAGHATPVVAIERLAPSSYYDLQYRTAIIASAIRCHAKPYAVNSVRIQTARLKLLQFIACRSWLIPMVQRWSDAQHDAQLALLASQRLRRGFLGDSMHDDVTGYLVAMGALTQSGSHVICPAENGLLADLYNAIVEADLFVTERDALDELGHIKITNPMLEGW